MDLSASHAMPPGRGVISVENESNVVKPGQIYPPSVPCTHENALLTDGSEVSPSAGDRGDEGDTSMSKDQASHVDVQDVRPVVPIPGALVCASISTSPMEELVERFNRLYTDSLNKALLPLVIKYGPWQSWG